MGWQDAPVVGGSWKDAPAVDDGSARLSDIPTGGVKGALDVGRGVAQMSPDWVKRGIRAIPGEASVEQFEKQPSRSWLESGSRFAGAAAPFVAGEIATGGGATPAEAALGAALWSGAAAGAQPTKEGTLASHGVEALEGAGAGMVPFGAGRALGATGRAIAGAPRAAVEHAASSMGRHMAAGGQEAVLHALGVPLHMGFGIPAWMVWRWLHHTPLSHTAGEWARSIAPYLQATGRGASKVGDVIESTAPGAGTVVGESQAP